MEIGSEVNKKQINALVRLGKNHDSSNIMKKLKVEDYTSIRLLNFVKPIVQFTMEKLT